MVFEGIVCLYPLSISVSLVKKKMENSKEDYKIQSLDLETQKLLKTALKGQSLM